MGRITVEVSRYLSAKLRSYWSGLLKNQANQPGTRIAESSVQPKGADAGLLEAIMMSRLIKLMFLAAVLVAAAFLIVTTPARATDDETATLYNTKCKMCHGATAEKKFDATKADDVLVQIILDGKAAEKPPNMPAYKDKGMTPEQAKALVTHMKSLKQ